MTHRSTLEVMLESLKRREEEPPDAPPALPQRPLSKARLPSMTRLRKAFVGVSGDPAEAFPGFRFHIDTNNRGELLQSRQNDSSEYPSEKSLVIRANGEANTCETSKLWCFPTPETVEVGPAVSIWGDRNGNSGGVNSFVSTIGEMDLATQKHGKITGITRYVEQDNEIAAASSCRPEKRTAIEMSHASVSPLVEYKKRCMDNGIVAGEGNIDLGDKDTLITTVTSGTDKACKESSAVHQINETVHFSDRENTESVVCRDHENVAERAHSEDKLMDTSFISGRNGQRSWKNEVASGLKENFRVWCLNPDNMWILGIIQSTTDADAIIRTEDSRLLKMPLTTVLPTNPHVLDGVDDLRQLSYLNEPSILHNIQYRYARGKIYTRAGPLLIVVNPFNKHSVHANDTVQPYKIENKDNFGPHVYATAECAFRAMMEDGASQSIIISGVSGSGKTQMANLAMQYLVALGHGDKVKIEILQIIPILEAFGNAKTLINDNSSRFGKLIGIYFQDCGRICGARIQNYLLEKSRVVHQAQGERSFHIFYQLCRGLDPILREHLNLRPAEEYLYLNQSGCMALDNVDDQALFDLTLKAMDRVKFSEEDQESAFTMLAAILWLGNIKFTVVDNENHVSVDDDIAVESAAKLLKCSKEHLIAAFSTRKIHGDIMQKLTYSQAVGSRDALAMRIYAYLFDWIVDRINKSLEVEEWRTRKSISILDFYGFESIETNGLEQVCINYANERLQHFFNHHLFKLEQEEYSCEGIEWTRIENKDNRNCLDLFEKEDMGFISVLNEECTLPNSTDSTLAYKLKEFLVGNSCFKGEREKIFRICHYTGEVFYDTTGFLEKNRDILISDLQQLLNSCETQLPRPFVTNANEDQQKLISPLQRYGTETLQQSVLTKFKWQLYELMQQLQGTTPHFIYCIKPNMLQLPSICDQNIVLQQLRCCGVLELVRISRSGYPLSLSHQYFANRFGFLLPQNLVAQQDALSICVAVLHWFNIQPDIYQVGYTKLFFRAGQIDRLENSRKQTLHGIICIQKIYKGYNARCYFKEMRRATIFLQSLVRGAKARRGYNALRGWHQAAIILQKFSRRRAAYQKYIQIQKMVILIQSVVRGWLTRKKLYAKRQSEEEKDAEVLKEDAATADERALHTGGTFDGSLIVGAESFDAINLHKTLDESHLTEPKVDMGPETTVKVQPSLLAELQNRVLAAEVALLEKENENSLLQQKLSQYEIRWSEYQVKMKCLEETWQKQIASLQLSLAAAKKSLETEESVSQVIKQDDSSNLWSKQQITRHIQPDSENDVYQDVNSSMGKKTPEQNLTLCKPTLHSLDISYRRGEPDAGRSVVSHLVKELEQRTQVFKDDTEFLVEVKSGQTDTNVNPEEELRKLSKRFDTWKKDFKVRLRETKRILQKLGKMESAVKTKKKWWGKGATNKRQ